MKFFPDNCCMPSGPEPIPHSELMRLHTDEGYQIESAQQMSYDKDNVDSYENRFDTFRMDYFDLAERSQKARAKTPVVSATPSSIDDVSQIDENQIDNSNSKKNEEQS